MLELYIYLGIYISIILIISLILSKNENSESFLISGRDRNSLYILFSKFSVSVGVAWFITYTAYAYEFGNDVFMILLGYIIGYSIFAYWASPKIYKHSRKNKFYTIGDYVYNNLKNGFAKLLTNIITIISQFFFVLVGIVGGAKIMSHFNLFSYEVSILITSLIILIYLILSGFKGVIITDLFQGIIILILLGFLSFSLIESQALSQVLSVKTSSLSLGSLVGFLIWGIMSTFASADRYQLCYAAKDIKALRRGMAFAIVPILIVAFFLLIIGLFMFSLNPNLDPDIVFLEALLSHLPQTLIPISLVLFFAGLMSSADSGIYAITSHFVFSKNPKNPKKEIRISIFIIILILTMISYFLRDIVAITIIGAAILLTLSVPMVYLLFGFKNENRFIGSVFGGIIGVILGIFIIGLDPSAAIFVLTGGLIGLLYNRNKK